MACDTHDIETRPDRHECPRRRHRPEDTVLYNVVEEHAEAFFARLGAEGASLPAFVHEEFERYLRCGRPEEGLPSALCASAVATSTWSRSARQVTRVLPLLRCAADGAERCRAGRARVAPVLVRH